MNIHWTLPKHLELIISFSLFYHFPDDALFQDNVTHIVTGKRRRKLQTEFFSFSLCLACWVSIAAISSRSTPPHHLFSFLYIPMTWQRWMSLSLALYLSVQPLTKAAVYIVTCVCVCVFVCVCVCVCVCVLRRKWEGDFVERHIRVLRETKYEKNFFCFYFGFRKKNMWWSNT